MSVNLLNKQKNNSWLLYLLLGVIIVYFSQGSLYPNGSIISKMSLLIWLLIDLQCFLLYSFKYKLSSFEKILFYFWLINTCYWFFSEKSLISEWGESLATFNSLKAISTTYLTYFSIRYFLKRNINMDKILSVFVFLLLIVFILSFYSFNARLLDKHNVEAITNNMGYRFVALLPLLGIFSKTKHLYVLIGISAYYIIMSSKRGAIICGLIAIVLLFIYIIKYIPREKKIKYSILLFGILGGLIYFLYNVFLSNEYLLHRLTSMQDGRDDSGNARIDQVTAIMEHVSNGSLFNLLFGYGFNKSVWIAGNYAHNDWAELLANMGLFGCVLYLVFFIKLINKYRYNRQYLSPKQKYMYMSVICMWLLISMFSMGYLGDNSFIFMIVIAYIVSIIEKNKKLCQG